ncbi:hypothetical protein GCM10007884_36030 [Methylobacterium brachythecii]|uniref:Uncharacterized protein n=1 Tax=Methylobacterium brachythecii TaxID=1176177 RepID=A0ABQ6D5H4_9HYPH|nr:hypothetical protein GCM10007884_36030 [Methylobacterium brachythecii]
MQVAGVIAEFQRIGLVACDQPEPALLSDPDHQGMALVENEDGSIEQGLIPRESNSDFLAADRGRPQPSAGDIAARDRENVDRMVVFEMMQSMGDLGVVPSSQDPVDDPHR